MSSLYESLTLYVSSERYTFEPQGGNIQSKIETLVIDRATGQLLYNAPVSSTLRQEEVRTIYGILGTIRLYSGEYICLVTSRERIGRLDGCDIYHLTGVDILPIHNNAPEKSTAHALYEDSKYISMIKYILQCQFLYFSYTYDLTHCVQQRQKLDSTKAMWDRADDRFFWNRHLHTKFIDASFNPNVDLSRFILPVICGFVEIKHCAINQSFFTFALVTRRSVYRAGTRYHSRGIDSNGHVSNCVETEQIVKLDVGQHLYSYVQTRGSVPFFWRQVINVRYTPLLVIDRREDTLPVMRSHFADQEARYGDQIVLNLLNSKGYEKPLVDEFGRLIGEMQDPRVHYVHFDFHHECKGMRFENVSKLVTLILPRLHQQGFFHRDGNGHIVQQQTSVCRTNCLDCLDRTNVVQSELGKFMLVRQLREARFLREDESLSEHPIFSSIFKNMWADNADAVSIMYSGTGALKTDFTRTGKRTRAGALQDLANSVTRYAKNNFFDGRRQDSFDLFLGVFKIAPNSAPIAVRRRTLKYYLLPALLLVSMFIFAHTLIFPTFPLVYTLYKMAFALMLGYLSVQLLYLFSYEFVDRPSLMINTESLLSLGIPTSLDVSDSTLRDAATGIKIA